MRIVFAAKDFNSGVDIKFKLYDMNGVKITHKMGDEIGNLGIYYKDFDLTPGEQYIIIASEVGGSWKAFKYIIGE